jgi:hypothetical protein
VFHSFFNAAFDIRFDVFPFEVEHAQYATQIPSGMIPVDAQFFMGCSGGGQTLLDLTGGFYEILCLLTSL